MPYKEQNIVKGAATIVFGGAEPGWTRDALTLGQEDDKLTIDDVQQKQGVVDIRRIKVGFVIKANLYEFTLENVKSAFGINASIVQGASTRTLSIDVSGDYPEGELIVYGKGPNNVERTVKFYKAKLIDRGEMSMDAHGATVIPVTWQVLIHPNHDDELGTITEEYVPSTTVDDL